MRQALARVLVPLSLIGVLAACGVNSNDVVDVGFTLSSGSPVLTRIQFQIAYTGGDFAGSKARCRAGLGILSADNTLPVSPTTTTTVPPTTVPASTTTSSTVSSSTTSVTTPKVGKPTRADRRGTTPVCGDGSVTGTEECDDGINDGSQGCNPGCILDPDGITAIDDSASHKLHVIVVNRAGIQPGFTIVTCAFVRDLEQDSESFGTAGLAAVVSYLVKSGSAAGTTVRVAVVEPTSPRPTCGNAVVEAGEDCDDGNTVQTDSCLNDCTSASCGDGFVCSGTGCTGGLAEECDLGADNSNSGICTASCKDAVCGDGHVCSESDCTSGPDNGPEECDDGNTTNGDGCSSDCATE